MPRPHLTWPGARVGAAGLVLLVGTVVGCSSPDGSPGGAQDRPTGSPAETLLSFVVNTRPADTALGEQAVTASRGTVVATWPQIGVVVAQSSSPGFAEDLRGRPGVQSAGATRTAAVTRPNEPAVPTEPVLPSVPVVPSEPVAPRGSTEPGLPPEGSAYDVAAIGADRARALPGGRGSEDVLVAVLDGGIEDTHPDLVGQVDAAASAGCTDGGRLRTERSAWLPTSSDHGTHVAGTIAALDNGFGVVGVAPGVRLSSVKVADDDGLIYPEYAICGYLWAAMSGAQVSNASLYVDPWQYWCPDAPDQAASIEAVGRAVAYATEQGVLNIAAAGNDSRDLTDKQVDTTSPNDTTPVERPIDSTCLDLPTELPGVVSASATGPDGTKAVFSNYGLGKIAVAAPGVDVWSTTAGGTYGTKSGTSMAAPHVAGVAALLASRMPGASPDELTQALLTQADDVPCPAATTPGFEQRCTGTAAVNAFVGEGRVDAFAAAGG